MGGMSAPNPGNTSSNAGNSGSGFPAGGGGGGGGGGGSGGDSPCTDIADVVILASPVSAVVRKLKVGDTLSIEMPTGEPPIIAKKDAEIAGSVIPRKLVDLVECLNGGHAFQAVVVAIKGGACTIRLQHRSSP